jgi:hypothetical protein
VTEENQKVLDVVQIEAFHHDRFVEDQVRHFMSLVKPAGEGRQVIVDVGGGIGLFAHRLRQLSGHELRVFDLDAASVDKCDRLGVPCTVGDALTPRFAGDEQIATFNMMLHHLVAQSEPATRELQKRALTAWRGRADRLFVNEYIYESWVGNLSGWLIYQITKSRVLSWIGRGGVDRRAVAARQYLRRRRAVSRRGGMAPAVRRRGISRDPSRRRRA